ncbi:hypothetical protein NKH36_14050 [Mesorhizobium sp. M1312]|uniref:hypothetical protein n=1 Tax=unclassified Mesorhizobium TaxID=325217 RepID=UPI00333B8C04
MDIMTALATAGLVIMVRFTPPGLRVLSFRSGGVSGSRHLRLQGAAPSERRLRPALIRLAIEFLAAVMEFFTDEAGPAAARQYRIVRLTMLIVAKKARMSAGMCGR